MPIDQRITVTASCLRAFVVSLLFQLVASAEPLEPKFRAQTIDDKIEIGYGVAAADVDGDGKTDILLADKRRFVWYRNPTWDKFIIAENLTKRDNVCLAAQDLDGDGKCELAVGADWDPSDRETSGAVFYMIAPEDRTQKWEPVKLHAEPTVHRMRWMQVPEGGWGLVVVPLHGRGKEPDAGSRILLYHKAEDPKDEWTTELLDDSMHATHNFDVLHRRGVVVAGREGLLEITRGNDGWAKRMLVACETGTGEVRRGGLPLRLPTELVAAIEPMHGNQLVIYTSPVMRNEFKRQVLTDKLIEGHALVLTHTYASPTILVGWRGGGGGIRLFQYLDARTWRETIIDDGGMACEDLCVADLDGDINLEIIACGRSTRNVKIYWNETGE